MRTQSSRCQGIQGLLVRSIAGALALLLPIAPVQAQPVELPIANPGFEANPVAPGCFAVFMPDGWEPFDPGGILDPSADVLGGLHPETGPYYPEAPEGQHVAIVFLSGDAGTTPAGLRQTLDAVLEPESRYYLSAWVGNIDSGTGPPPCDVFGFFNLAGFPGYQVQLLAGGQVIAQDDNSLAGTLGEGEFAPTIIGIDIPSDHPQLGQPLEIRLINLNLPGTPKEPGIEVNFDAISLTVEPIPTKQCPGDLNDDLIVDSDDLSLLLGAFGTTGDGDLDDDGDTDSDDLAILLSAFGIPCSAP
ncbi:MAG: hypothetical protein ACTS3F_14205 [Phycisphaerales bacterium]